MSLAAAAQIKRVEDRVIARARNRRRPLMPDDETVIRVLCAESAPAMLASTPDDEDSVVETLVAVLGNLEFEIPAAGGFELRLRKPDDSLYPDDAPGQSHEPGEHHV